MKHIKPDSDCCRPSKRRIISRKDLNLVLGKSPPPPTPSKSPSENCPIAKVPLELRVKQNHYIFWVSTYILYALKYLQTHYHHHQSLNREGRWGTTDDFATSFLHFSCSLLPSGTYWTPGLSISWCCLPTSSSVCLVFFPLSLCLARWFWPDLMNGKHDHTAAVCISLRSSGGLRVVQLPAGSWHRLPCW